MTNACVQMAQKRALKAMKTTLDYLDELKAKMGTESDSAAARHIGVTQGYLSKIRNGKAVMNDYVCGRIAMELNIDPLEVIAAANQEAEQDPAKREFWGNLLAARRATVAAMLIAASSSSISAPRIEANSIGRGYDVWLHDINIMRIYECR